MRIAIVKLTAMGDIINAAVVLQFIKAHYPDARIEWVCEAVFAPILEDNPDLDAIHTVNIKQIKKAKSFSMLAALVKKLRGLGPYDLIMDMQGLIKSAVVARLIGKKVRGFDRRSIRESAAAWFYERGASIAYDANTIERNVKVAADALDFTLSREALQNKKPFLFSHGEQFAFEPLLKEKNVLLVVGSTWPSKNYPKEQFARVADLLGINCIVTWGNDEEREWAEWITAHSANAVMAPKLSLNDLKALVARADLLIGNDTGPSHLAWAMNRPSIMLFGCTPPLRMYETPINRYLESSSYVDPLKLDRNDFSIKEIAPETICIMARELLYGDTD